MTFAGPIAHAPTLGVPTPAPLVLALFPLGEVCGGDTEGSEPAQTEPQDLCCRDLRPDPVPEREVTADGQTASSSLALALAPPPRATPPSKGTATIMLSGKV